MPGLTIHERAKSALRYLRGRADRIARYSRAPDAQERARALLVRAMREAVRTAYDAEWTSLDRPGIDSGRRAPEGVRYWGGWLDAGDCTGLGGWQLYSVAVRDLIMRRFDPALARRIAAALTCHDRGVFVCDVLVGVRPPEVLTAGVQTYGWEHRHGLDIPADHVRAWTAWASAIRSQQYDPATMAGRRTRRWLAVGVESRRQRGAA